MKIILLIAALVAALLGSGMAQAAPGPMAIQLTPTEPPPITYTPAATATDLPFDEPPPIPEQTHTPVTTLPSIELTFTPEDTVTPFPQIPTHDPCLFCILPTETPTPTVMPLITPLPMPMLPIRWVYYAPQFHQGAR